MNSRNSETAAATEAPKTEEAPAEAAAETEAPKEEKKEEKVSRKAFTPKAVVLIPASEG